jgi:hypothetical protein
MGIVFDHMTFKRHAPDLAHISAKITELTGLAMVATESSDEVKGTLYDLHAHLAFACVPEEMIEVFSYRVGAVKEFYEAYTEGIKLPTERFVAGLHEPPGTQAIYLRGSIGQEPTLFMATILALEALGGEPREPLPEDQRREYGRPITIAELQERRRKTHRQLGWAAVVYVLLLPLTIPLFLLGLLMTFVMMPVRLYKAMQIYHEHVQQSEHQDLMALLPDHMEFLEIEPEDFPELDVHALRKYTQALQALGFVFALDYTIHTDAPDSSGGFARLFFHPTHKCLAEINQGFTRNGAVSTMRCMLGTLFTDRWDLTTTDREPTDLVMSYAWRRPRNLWSCHPGYSLSELLAEHLRRRNQMIESVHIAVIALSTAEAYFDHERATMAERKAVLSLKSMETIQAEIEEVTRKPRYEWLGDLA